MEHVTPGSGQTNALLRCGFLLLDGLQILNGVLFVRRASTTSILFIVRLSLKNGRDRNDHRYEQGLLPLERGSELFEEELHSADSERLVHRPNVWWQGDEKILLMA